MKPRSLKSLWLIDNPALFIDLYELTMTQAYLVKGMREKAYFEVIVRHLPKNWGFFVMAGLAELEEYLKKFHFSHEAIEFLRSKKLFNDEFLQYLSALKVDVKIRALPEGTVFFPEEPVIEVEGDLICAQLLETYVLNILGFSIISATLAARIIIAAKGIDVVDFGLRRSQGPVASLRAARAAKMAGFKGTSNLYAAKLLDFPSSGTMAHSFVEVYESEEESFLDYFRLYGERAIFLIDTYDSINGIIKAADIAAEIYKNKGIKTAGIRIDSGDLIELSKFARRCFKEKNVSFMKIYVSGDLDEYKIDELLMNGAEIDGIGVGTRFVVSKNAPSIDIVYKIVQYGDRPLYKTSPEKKSRPGRKSIKRIGDKYFEKDIVSRHESKKDDLLKPFESAEDMETIQKRLREQLSRLSTDIKSFKNPAKYRIDFEKGI